MRKRIAIIGSGISGLTAAHRLHAAHDLTVFEAGAHVGGHTNTVRVAEGDRELAIDTGFIVYNERTYPNFCKLLAQLRVATQPSVMSFSVRDERCGLEYMGDSVNTLFAQRRNLLRPAFYRMLIEIVRFYRESRRLLATPDGGVTLGSYLAENRYSSEFVEQHLIPMGAAIWSADPQQFYDFPAAYFVRFCHNHGMLNLFRRPQWRVIRGGSAEYVRALIAPFADRIRLNSPVEWVRREPAHVEVAVAGRVQRFDEVIFATHSDQALRLLRDPSPSEQSVLGAIRYQRNHTVLHTDERLLPRSRRAWASWNYHVPERSRGGVTMTYNMNMLQTLSSSRTYCVSLNCGDRIDEHQILRTFEYHHPVYTPAAVAAQQRHAEISGVNRTHYCGAYWGYGFHEDGVNSGMRVAAAVDGRS